MNLSSISFSVIDQLLPGLASLPGRLVKTGPAETSEDTSFGSSAVFPAGELALWKQYKC